MSDPYATLGLQRGATDVEIRAAFKRLTRKHHPDLNPGDKAAEERFKGISTAHDLLADPDRRRRFDAGEIDASGTERPRGRFYRDFAGGAAPRPGGGAGQGPGGLGPDDIEDFLARAFGAAGHRARAGGALKGQDMTYAMQVGFLDAANGAVRTITLPEGKTLRVTIPQGAEDGQTLRLRGQGGPGQGGGPVGDAFVKLAVEGHPHFRRSGDDIHIEVPVGLREAVLGARIDVPTISGPVSLAVPRGSNTGRVLRLRDKGVRNGRSGARGHQLVTLKVVLPAAEDAALTAFLETWKPEAPQDLRREMLR